MNSRRKFIVQGSLATTALVVAQPMNALATFTSPLASEGLSQVTFLHTALPGTAAANQIRKIRYDHTNPVLLNVGNNKEEQSMNYDAAAGSLPEHFDGNYKIIDKGKFRIAVIETASGDWNTTDKINLLAASLKKDENCHLVVCLSQLGFKNRSSVDDVRLAEKSENVDIIIGKQSSSSPRSPYIALNKKRSEVILHYSDDRDGAIGKIKIAFNKQGSKQKIEFDHRFRPVGTA